MQQTGGPVQFAELGLKFAQLLTPLVVLFLQDLQLGVQSLLCRGIELLLAGADLGFFLGDPNYLSVLEAAGAGYGKVVLGE